MPETPLISIVMPSYNQAAYLEQALRSVLEQDCPGTEVLVVDGGSTDGSVEIIRRYADRLAWWVSEKDRGQSHAINKGLGLCDGEWFNWINSDDYLMSGALHSLACGAGDPSRPVPGPPRCSAAATRGSAGIAPGPCSSRRR